MTSLLPPFPLFIPSLSHVLQLGQDPHEDLGHDHLVVAPGHRRWLRGTRSVPLVLLVAVLVRAILLLLLPFFLLFFLIILMFLQ